MYFFRLKKLLAELQAEPANDNRTFKYFFATSIILTLAIIPALLKPNKHSSLSVNLIIAAAIVKLAGILYCYIVNGGKNGQYFFHRVFPIAWVMFFRLALPLLLLLLILAPIILNLLGVNIGTLSKTDIDAIINATVLITAIVLWWRIAINIKSIAMSW